MKFDDEFPKRVAIHRAGFGYTQSQLATKVGVVQRQIAAYEAGAAKPRDAVLLRMAKVFGVSPEFLAHGGSLFEDQSYKGVKAMHSRIPGAPALDTIPLISMNEVSNWLDGMSQDKVDIKAKISSNLPVSKLAFALLIDEPAMAFSDPLGYGIPRKSIVIFEPELDVEDQDFVLALMPDGGALFRQYFSGYRGDTLHALDSRYPQEVLSDYIDEDNNAPMLIVAISYEAYLPSSERLKPR